MKKFDKNFWKGKKVFITGHTGFKGSWLCIILNNLKAKIYGFSLKPKKISLFNQSKISKNLSSNTFGNILDIRLLKKKIKTIKPEIIFHLAAQPLVIDSYKNPLETFETNIMGTVNLLECLRNIDSIKSVVIITTDKVYKIKKKNKSYSELDELGGYDPYSSSKVASEIAVNSYVESFFKKTNLKNRISTVRAGNVVGGGDYSENRLLPDIIKSINCNSKLTIRNPNSIRPWQHVLEPLVGYLTLAKYQFKGKIYEKNNTWNFGPKKNNSKKVIAIIKIMQKLNPFTLNIKKNNKYKETEVLKLNSNKSKKKLKWYPKMTLQSTLKEVFDWNHQVRNKVSAKEVCVNQFLMYINKK
ncbi:CDP-glucose 4,6-dehydratase [Candidatus Pelagibacter sp.]|nr:CDP-glucose 4,6-dehydratase [Candidatus Pelagibacter sp.]